MKNNSLKILVQLAIIKVIGLFFLCSQMLMAQPASYETEVQYKPSLSWINYPYSISGGLTAFTLMDNYGGDTVVASLSRLDAATGQLQTASYSGGVPAGTDFSINVDEGYILVAQQAFSYIYGAGNACPPTSLSIGQNLIGFSCLPSDFSAYDLIQHLGTPESIASVQRLEPETGLYQTVSWKSNGEPSGINFSVLSTGAYLVNAKQALVVSQPVSFPDVSNLSIADGTVINSDTFELTGTVSDSSTTVTVNGQPASIVNGEFTIQLDTQVGVQTIEVIARNGSVTNRHTFTVNGNIAPRFSIDSNLNDETVYSNDLVVFGTLQTPASLVSSVTVNGQLAQIVGDTFIYGTLCVDFFTSECANGQDDPVDRITLNDGSNTITVQVTGTNSLVATQEIIVNRERLSVNAVNPGDVLFLLSDIRLPPTIASEVTQYNIRLDYNAANSFSFGNAGIVDPFNGRFYPAHTTITSSDNSFDVEMGFEAFNTLNGSFDGWFRLEFGNSENDTVYTIPVLVTVVIPISTVVPALSLEDYFEGLTINESQVLVWGYVSGSVTQVTVNGVSADLYSDDLREDRTYVARNVPLSLGVSPINVQAVTASALSALQVVNVNVEPIELTFNGDETQERIRTLYSAPEIWQDQISSTMHTNLSFIDAPSFFDGSRTGYSKKNFLGDTEFDFSIETIAPLSGVYDFDVSWWVQGTGHSANFPIRATVIESADPPDITLYWPSDGATVPQSPLGVTVVVTNDAAANVTINGVSASRNKIPGVKFLGDPDKPHRSYTAIVNLPNEGNNTINVQAVGFNGLSSNVPFTLNLATTLPPTVNMTSHSNGDVVTVDPIDISVSSSAGSNSELTLYENGIEVSTQASSDGNTTWAALALVEGDNTFEWYQPGYLDPVLSQTITLQIPPAPILNISSHNNGETESSDRITIFGSVINPVSQITVNGVPAQINGTSFSIDDILLVDGENLIEVIAQGPGAQGKTDTATITLNYNPVSVSAHQITLSRLGSSVELLHEFRVPSAVYQAVQNQGGVLTSDQYLPDWMAANQIFSYQLLADNRIQVTVRASMSALAGSAPLGIGTHPLLVNFKDNASQNLTWQEVVYMGVTVVDGFSLYPNASISLTEQFYLDPLVLDGSITEIKNNIPSGVVHSSYNKFSPDITGVPGLWRAHAGLLAEYDLPAGFLSTDVTFEFRTSPGNALFDVVNRIHSIQILERPTPQPTVLVTSHQDGQTVTESTLLVFGTVEDVNASVMVNGQIAVVNAVNYGGAGDIPINLVTGFFYAIVNVVDGDNPITVNASNSTGFTSSESFTITKGGIPSNELVTVPVGGSVNFTHSTDVSSDDAAGANCYFTNFCDTCGGLGLTLTGSPIGGYASPTTIWGHNLSASVSTPVGLHTLDLTHTLAASNSGSCRPIVAIQSQRIVSIFDWSLLPLVPTIVVTSHQNNDAVTSSPVTLMGTVGDENAVVDADGVSAILTPVGDGTAAFSVDVPLVDGTNPITITATSPSGLVRTLDIDIRLTSAPSGDLVMQAGSSVSSSYRMHLTPAEFASTGSFNLGISINAGGILSNLSFDSIQSGGTSGAPYFDFGYTLSSFASAAPGVYTVTMTWDALESSSGPTVVTQVDVVQLEIVP